MSADPLASLLVREGVLPHARVEEAQERQVLTGGTLDTSLLELGLLDEPRLLEILPRAYNARAVGKGELAGVDKAVTSVFPRRLSEKHGVVPVDISGRRLTVATAGPPDLALLDEIGFMLSVYVKPAVTTQARLSWAQARLYGIPMPPRMEALLKRVGEDPAETRAAVDAWQARSAPSTKATPRPAPPPSAAPPDASGWTVGPRAGLDPSQPSTPRLEIVDGGTIEAQAEVERQDRKPVDADAAREDRRRNERVLWTVDDAIAELALAEDRDGMLDVVLRFGYRRLSTVAVFVLTRSADGVQAFVGWDVIDPLLGKKDIAKFQLPADGKHALAQVLSMKSPFLGPLKREDPLVRLFGRRARAVILVPILVGDRCIGAFYGDCGSKVIPPSSLAELHMVVPRLGKGLGNLILRKKKALRAEAQQQDAPVVVGPLATGAPAIEDEESIAVKARAPSRVVPTIEIDITEVDAFEPITAPSSLSSDPSPPAEEVAAKQEPKEMPWADGRDDDEDVRLDEVALADLDGKKPAKGDAARIELGLDEQIAPDDDEPPSIDPRDDVDEPSDPGTHPFKKLVAEVACDEGAPAPLPAEIARDLVATAAPEPGSVAPSPGASARESLLLATHAGWMGHEDAVLDELVGQLHKPGESQRKAAVAAVVAHGERALPSLARYFPGVLAVHPFGPMEHRPDVEEVSDCLACLARLGADAAAPILCAELGHDDRLHRWTAVWALSQLKAPGALPRLTQRLFDPEPSIAALAAEVLDGYRGAPGFQKALAQVRDLARRGDDFERQRAILAVGELRDREALTALVDLLGTRPKEIAEEARRALVEITKQDFGAAERRWRAWIADNEKVPRTRWLIEGLSSKDDDVRKSAQAELNRLTGQFFGYRWDAPRPDRDTAVAQWNAWWEQQQKEAPGKWP